MKILIAPDSFRGSLSSTEVSGRLAKGILRVLPQSQIKNLPMADGGEGTVEAIITATQGRYIDIEVHDPLMRKIISRYGITGDGKTAIMEMAAASGVELLKMKERNPWITSTYGTGELIKSALDHMCERIIIGIGGSATNDGGSGMASALGVKFIGKRGQIVPGEGGMLSEVERIDSSAIDSRLSRVEILVACDVTNPLTGKDGAANVFGRQKGADDDMVAKLDMNLKHFASIISRDLVVDIENIPGAGAAGGLGGGLMAFLNAQLMNGFKLISEIIELENEIIKADLIITGEGKIDYQTQFGKTAFGVASLAEKNYKPVIAVAGTVEEESSVLYEKGMNVIVSIIDKPMTLEEAIMQAPRLLERTGERIARLLLTGNKLKLND